MEASFGCKNLFEDALLGVKIQIKLSFAVGLMIGMAISLLLNLEAQKILRVQVIAGRGGGAYPNLNEIDLSAAQVTTQETYGWPYSIVVVSSSNVHDVVRHERTFDMGGDRLLIKVIVNIFANLSIIVLVAFCITTIAQSQVSTKLRVLVVSSLTRFLHKNADAGRSRTGIGSDSEVEREGK